MYVDTSVNRTAFMKHMNMYQTVVLIKNRMDISHLKLFSVRLRDTKLTLSLDYTRHLNAGKILRNAQRKRTLHNRCLRDNGADKL